VCLPHVALVGAGLIGSGRRPLSAVPARQDVVPGVIATRSRVSVSFAGSPGADRDYRLVTGTTVSRIVAVRAGAPRVNLGLLPLT
jgi:hypothetical protein